MGLVSPTQALRARQARAAAQQARQLGLGPQWQQQQRRQQEQRAGMPPPRPYSSGSSGARSRDSDEAQRAAQERARADGQRRDLARLQYALEQGGAQAGAGVAQLREQVALVRARAEASDKARVPA